MDPSLPPVPEQQPAQTPPPPPPPAKPGFFSLAVRPLKTMGAKRIIIGLITLVVVGGLAFYTGWRIGYDAGTNQPQSDTQNPDRCNGCNIVLKPVIYLYPTQTEPVRVRLNFPAGFLATTPAYNAQTGWQVQASPGGQLTDLSSGRTYPYLFWEGKPSPVKYDMSAGFVVPGRQTKAFLSRELPTIGLSPAETAAFIDFWKPRMSGNTYNLIHFAGREYTDYAKLTITPQPDSELRVFMVFRPLKQPVKVTPQVFPGFQRNGFTAVEWGGTKLKP